MLDQLECGRRIIAYSEQLPALWEELLPSYLADPAAGLPAELENLDYTPIVEELTWKALGEYDFTAEVGALEQPVLLLWGVNDPYGTVKQVDAAKAGCTCPLEVRMMPDSSHWPFREEPEATLAEIKAFVANILKTQDPARTPAP